MNRPLLYPTSCVTDSSAVMTDTISPPDDRADGDDGERTDDADDPVKAALQFRLVEFGDSARQHRQLPGFLAQPQHADRHRRHVA